MNLDRLSSEDTDLMIVNQLRCAQKLIDIRDKYYKEFETVLQPQQISSPIKQRRIGAKKFWPERKEG